MNFNFQSLFDTTGFQPRGPVLGWSDEMLFWYNTSEFLITLSCYTLAGIFLIYLRRRHERSVRHIFWFMGTALFLFAIVHTSIIVTHSNPIYRFDLFTRILCATILIVTVCLTILRLPRIMTVPNIESLTTLHEKLLTEITDLKARVSKLAHEDPVLGELYLHSVLQNIQAIPKENPPYETQS